MGASIKISTILVIVGFVAIVGGIIVYLPISPLGLPLIIWDFLNSLPAVFWGMFFGSLLSLTGIVLSNRADHHRLLEQLKHERKQTLKDNEYSIKKEIFLQSAEAFAAGVNSIASFANLQIPFADVIKPYTDRSFVLAKLQIVANEDTLKVSSELSVELTSRILHLTGKRLELELLQGEVNTLSNETTLHLEKQGEAVQLMTEYNNKKLVDQERWDAIQAQYEFHTESFHDNSKKIEKTRKAQIAMQLEFSEECAKECAELGRFSLPTILAIRDELGLAIDKRRLLDIYNKNAERSMLDAASFFDKMKERLNKVISDNLE